MEPSAPERFCASARFARQNQKERGKPRSGRRRAKVVAGTTGEPFDEPTTQKRPALRVASGRAPASLRRSTDVPASLFAARLADRLAGTQRRLFPYEKDVL
jgi:hypothetical protein